MSDQDQYDVLPLPVNLFEQPGNQVNLKPFVAVYFPAELLEKMRWNRKTPLSLLIDGETLLISKKDLEYEIDPEGESEYL